MKKIRKPNLKELKYHLRKIYLGYFLREGFSFDLAVRNSEEATDLLLEWIKEGGIVATDDASSDAGEGE